MQPPDELMANTFLPAMRKLVASHLEAQGLPQSAISSILGVTQASVSLYHSHGTGRAYSALSDLSITKQEADRFASRLAEEARVNPVSAVRTLNEIWTDLLGSGAVCTAHRSLYPSLAECKVCIELYGGKSTTSKTVSEVADALKMLEASASFVSVMPEVSVNVACAAGDARTPEDVVAIPGRIVKLKGRAKGLLPPEAGASAHMSRVLLLARKRRPDLRACINVKYDKRMARTIKSLGLRALTIRSSGARDVEDPTAEALERALPGAKTFDIVVYSGGGGLEPNVYLFAEGAVEAAEMALRVARAYLAR
jgi:predicted fused transcriptional regulator/phosphomethylpyrimidine kinase/predicted transcriptional regulator